MEDDEKLKDKDEDESLEKASDSDFVRQALQDETEGLSSYEQAMQTVQDPKLKEILAAIHEDEKKHNMALEAWLKETDPAALESHEGEETPDQETAEDDEAIEGKSQDMGELPGIDDEDGEEDGTGAGTKEDLITAIEAVLAEHDDGSDEEIDKDADEEGDKPDEDDEEQTEKCSMKKSYRVPLIKSKGDLQIVYGVVSEPDVIDLQGDRLSKSEIRKACHKFMMESQRINKEHEGPARADIIESYIAPVDFKCNGQVVKAGSWVMAVKIHDDDLWGAVKKGEITGFSIAGQGERVPFGN